MKCLKIITIFIIFWACIIIASISYANSNIKSILHIDTNLENAIFDKTGIHISGWKLAIEPDTKLVVSIDGKEVDSSCIKYSYKYDLISIVKGYGTYKENPAPNFDINIPTTDIKDGKHKLKIQFVSKNGITLHSVEKVMTVEKVKHVLQIDTNLNNATFDKSGIHISGWKLATEPDTQLVTYIDGQKIDSNYTKYSYKYDLISIVKGYGTYKENPTPNYDINIPTDNISDGKHNIKIEFTLQDGTILEQVEKSIIIDKSIKSIMHIDTDLEDVIFNENKNIHISGWKLATEPGSKLIVSIDGQEIDSNYINYSYKYDLISIVKGYGTYKENPKPNFDINIPVEKLNKKDYKIEIKFVAPDGVTVLDNVQFVAKYKEKYNGIDVSVFNGDINWKQVAKSGVDFAMIRLGYRGYRNPVLVLDSKALYNIREAKAAGLKVGIYFVTQATNIHEAREEGLWIISQIHQNGLEIDFPIAIDTEDSGATSRGEAPGRADLLDRYTRTMTCRAIADIINYYGYTPMIYANHYWYDYHLNYSELAGYEIWLAQYTYSENIKPNFSEPYQMWQYTDKGSVNGISGNVDKNIYFK